MKTGVKIAGGVLVVIVAVYGAFRYRQWKNAQQAGIISENIEHNGDVWNADFLARVPAPEEKVFDAIKNVEDSHSSMIKAVRVVSSTANSKRVEMDMTAMGGQTQTVTFDFTYDPVAHRIGYKSVGNPQIQTDAEYDLEDQGATTLIRLRQTTAMPAGVPLPDGMVKEVIRGIFVAQMDALKKSLHIADSGAADAGDDD